MSTNPLDSIDIVSLAERNPTEWDDEELAAMISYLQDTRKKHLEAEATKSAKKSTKSSKSLEEILKTKGGDVDRD